jgi:hypothetical protein
MAMLNNQMVDVINCFFLKPLSITGADWRFQLALTPP